MSGRFARLRLPFRSYVLSFLMAGMMIALAGGAVHPARAQADIMSQLNAIVEQSSAELAVQINLSGRQRMLTQKMSKEAFLVALGVDPEENRQNAAKTAALFERTLKGLMQGDEALKLAPAPNEKILAQLKKVEGLWRRFKPLIEKVAAGDVSRPVLERIAKENLPLLAEMNKAVKLFEKAAGTDTAELALVINLSGRQRMLTQKMTKEYLLVALKIEPEKNRQNLARTMALFETTLKGLKDGNDILPPTKDPKIRAQLDKVFSLWGQFKPLLSRPATPENLKAIARLNLPLLAEMNRAVKMYEESW